MRHPKLGNIFTRYKFLSGGGGKIDAPKPTPPAPRLVGPELQKTKQDINERLRRQKGRAASRVTFGDLGPVDTFKAELEDKLA